MLTATLGFEESYAILSCDGATTFNSIYRHSFLLTLEGTATCVISYAKTLYPRESSKLRFEIDVGVFVGSG